MVKKLLVILVCLVLMPALVTWAASTYYIQTKITNAGGSVRVRSFAPQSGANSIKYTNMTTQQPVAVTVTPDANYQILSVVKNGTAVPLGDPTVPLTVSFVKNGPNTTETQTLLASFTTRSGANVVAKTWQLQTSNLNGGGYITTTRGADAPIVLSAVGSVEMKNYPDTTPVKVKVTPTLGNQIASVTLNGSAVSLAPNGAETSFTIDPSVGGLVQAVKATYTKASVPVSTLTTGITPINPVVAFGGTLALTVAPPGTQNTVTSLTVSPGPTVTMVDNSGNTKAPFYGPVTVTLTNITAPISVAAVYGTDNTQMVLQSCANTCHLGASAAVQAVPGVWLASGHKTVNVDCVTCHQTMPGPYVRASVSATTFKVIDARAGTLGDYYCNNCHTPTIGAGFDGSKHTTLGRLSCTACHTQGVHNPAVNPAVCGGCHFDGSGNIPLHPVPIGVTVCTTCHNPHTLVSSLASQLGSLHFNNQTGAGYPASFVTSRAACTDCHYVSAGNPVIRQQWYTSAHAQTTGAPWSSRDFKTMSGCVQCHTTTGFVAYSTGKVTAAWGAAGDKTKELLTCRGCHVSIATGELRHQSPVRPYSGDAYQNPEVGKSNLCLTCHSGTNSGASIQTLFQAGADFTNLPFVAPHGKSASATFYAKGGYPFPGQDYPGNPTHAGIGAADGSGPCITCHKNPNNGHTFRTGAIALCTGCHGTALTQAVVDANRTAFLGALAVLRAQLAAKGFVYTPAAPYFASRNWGAGQTGANTMGAAYNYVLLTREPAAFAHNPQYARQLVLDSIDFLDNGQLDGSVTSVALPDLVAAGAISADQSASLGNYQGKSFCISCHGGPASSPSPMASKAHPAHLSAAYGPGAYLGSDASVCASCHVTGIGSHLNGRVEVSAAAGSACVNCHAGAAPLWQAGRIACTVCHAAVPAKLPNGVAAPYKARFSSTGHGLYAPSDQCTSCHDANSRHISGSLGDYNRLLLNNDNNLCASCHSDATKVSGARLNMVSHITPDGRTLGCLECHDPHGSANLHMIRSVINGSNIVFTDAVNGLIDPVGNRGLCQVCHTLTNHYRAGIAETNHYTSGCLNCHTHNTTAGAFRPTAGGSCDSCHGYPPAPKNTGAVFGLAGQYQNARFEDYSGGGGAHLVAAHISPNAKASEGWQNCAGCHNFGNTASTPYHRMVTPVKSNIANVTVAVDPKLRFADSFIVYSGARLFNPPALNQTGNCFNIACHMSPSAPWSTER